LKLAVPRSPSTVPKPFMVARGGFSLNAAVAFAADQREGIERQASKQGGAGHAGVRRPGRMRRSHAQAGAQALGRTQPEGDQHLPTAPMTWMERLRRVFAIDLRGARGLCPHCGGRERVIAGPDFRT
jgi:hypothetical protein